MKRIALVTGASSGIGAACAAHLEKRGYQVYGGARNTPGLIPLDVTSDDSVAAAIAEILEREGRIDVVVNNAGMALAGAIEDTTPADALRQFEVNFFGVLRVCRAALPAMRAQKSGYIVNIGSIAGLIAVPFQGLYSASKFAVEGFTESLRYEVSPFGIRVVLVEPGDHRTGMTANRRVIESAEYGDQARRAIAKMANEEQAGPDPSNVAELVGRILATRNPRLRYTCGPASQRAAVWLKRLAPGALVEYIIRDHYK